jgi:hypothetical protein
MMIRMTTKKITGTHTKNGAKKKGKEEPTRKETKNAPKMRIATTAMRIGMSCCWVGLRRGAAGYHACGAGGG